jgi:hypothetical protein
VLAGLQLDNYFLFDLSIEEEKTRMGLNKKASSSD